MPKYIMGVPVDRWSGFMARKLKFPTRLTRALMRRLMFLAVGDQARYGVPKPKHAIWQEHATLSQELLPYVGHGWISIKPNVQELRAGEVGFDDGSSQPVDAIIYATGYKTTFPFIDRSLFEVKDGGVALYRRIVIPMLRPAFLSAFVILFHMAIKSYDLVIALTGGGPGRATELPATFMYSYTFTRNSMGIGAASAVIMLMTVAAIMIPYLYSELGAKKE